MPRRFLSLLGLAVLIWSAPAAANQAVAESGTFLPNAGRLEIGAYGGMLFMGGNYAHYNIAEGTRAPLEQESFGAGVRIGYALLGPQVSLEAEADWSTLTTESDENQGIYGARAHLLYQRPGRVAPFFLVGGGGVIVRGAPLGDDEDPAVHWGAGVKWYMYDSLTLRLEGRHVITEGEQPRTLRNATAHHFMFTLGVGYSLLGG